MAADGRQALLRREQECQAREEARYAARRLKGRRPRERRRGGESEPSVAGRGHSLDNMAAEGRGSGATEPRRKGVAGRTAEGTVPAGAAASRGGDGCCAADSALRHGAEAYPVYCLSSYGDFRIS